MHPDQRVLYLGDWDWCGQQIEEHSRHTLAEHTGVLERDWERVALTEEQVIEHELPRITKVDNRYKPPLGFEAVETEALSQREIVAAVVARLDDLLPEPLGNVLERERAQRAAVAEQLRGMQR